MSAVASTPPATRTIASLPGPRTLPLIGNLHQFDARRSHQIFESMARKYGPAFKFKLGPHQLVVLADAEAAMKVLRDRPNEFTRSRVTRWATKLNQVITMDGCIQILRCSRPTSPA